MEVNRPRRRHAERSSVSCRAGNGCSRHAWLVTTAVEDRRSWPRQPWGTVHIRANGDLLTACGIFAVGWPVFFEQEFQPRATNACPHCARVVHLQQMGHAPDESPRSA